MTRFSLARHWRETPLALVLSPMQRFVQSETASGVVLIVVTALALMIANSPLAASYDAVLHTEIGVSVGPFVLRESVLHWINDGLMALFFFLVGLELKREAIVGELANLRHAALPVVAATGGAIVPALLYTLVNAGGVGARGWGVPMATDIAFALGVLALLGRRVPWSLKVFLTAVAVIDDLLAVLVIALFYTSEIHLGALGIGFAVLALLILANVLGIRSLPIYILLGVVVWLAFLESGVHATIAGVLVALTVPARHKINEQDFLSRVSSLLDRFAQGNSNDSPMLIDERQSSAVLALEDACEAVQAPLQRMEHGLHSWVSFGVMPIFALANAGVALSPDGIGGAGSRIILGVVVGLVLGKPIGLVGSVWLMVRLGVAELPQGVGWTHIFGVGFLAGLGFTMSLFIAALGFDDPALLGAAKLGILSASVIAGLAGYLLLRRSGRAVER